MNKYAQIPDQIVDLHGYTVREAEEALNDLLTRKRPAHIRVITGKGTLRATGPVLKTFVREYLAARSIRYNQSKLQDGGEGAFEVFL